MSFCGSPSCFLAVALFCSIFCAVALTVQEVLLYKRLHSLVEQIEFFSEAVIRSSNLK